MPCPLHDAADRTIPDIAHVPDEVERHRVLVGVFSEEDTLHSAMNDVRDRDEPRLHVKFDAWQVPVMAEQEREDEGHRPGDIAQWTDCGYVPVLKT